MLASVDGISPAIRAQFCDFGGRRGGGAPRKCLQHQSKTGNVLSIAPDNGHMGDHHAHYTQTSHHVAPTRDTVFSIALRSLALLQLLLRIISSYWHGSAIRCCMDSSGLHLRQPIAGGMLSFRGQLTNLCISGPYYQVDNVGCVVASSRIHPGTAIRKRQPADRWVSKIARLTSIPTTRDKLDNFQ